MEELFGVEPAINIHLKIIFETGELQEDTAISKRETTAADDIISILSNNHNDNE